MAIPKPQSAKLFRWRTWLLWLGLIMALVLALLWSKLHSYALTGAAYGAHMGCTCHYIGGRKLGDCRKDFEPGMGLIFLSANAEQKSVTARFPLVARQTATFKEGAGCVLEKWED